MSYQIHRKLISLKKILKLKYLNTPIEASVLMAEKALLEMQEQVQDFPGNDEYKNAECELAVQLRRTRRDFHSFLSQRAKITWLNCGDDITKVFLQSLKQQSTSNTINILQSNSGFIYDPVMIQTIFQKFYKDIFFSSFQNRRRINMEVIHMGPILSRNNWSMLICLSHLRRSKKHYGIFLKINPQV